MQKQKTKFKYLAVFLAALAALGCVPGAFAETANKYGISYTGGEPLSDANVTIDPSLVGGLTPLMGDSGRQVNVGNQQWKDGYFVGGNGGCFKTKYFTVSQQDNTNLGYSYTISKGDYTMKVDIDEVHVYDYTAQEGSDWELAVLIAMDGGNIDAGRAVESKPTCDGTLVSDSPDVLSLANGAKMFVQTNITLYKDGIQKPFVSDELYFGITDIDAAQSYKILNSDSLLKKGTMFASAESDIQPSSEVSTTLRNYFVTNDNYIYSQYDETGAFNVDGDGKGILVKLGSQTQSSGLDMVYGFATQAGSGMEYYAKQYKVQYISDANGSISGITNEQVISGDNPSGSSSAPKDNYKFEYWVSDVDVTLEDGTVVKAGEPMTSEQVKKVVVHQDIVFKAIHKSTLASAPDTGSFTSGPNSAILVTGLVLPVVFVGFGLAKHIIDRKNHKVSFKK